MIQVLSARVCSLNGKSVYYYCSLNMNSKLITYDDFFSDQRKLEGNDGCQHRFRVGTVLCRYRLRGGNIAVA